MATTRQTLKQYFRQYATPTEAQFTALIDAFVHKDEDSLTQSKIDGLVAALEGKASTNQVNTMVASKVSEILSDPQFSAAPTAHSHVAADVEGLSAFITRVTNFLDSADASDTTINRWKELEAFITGITDSDTLAGMLAALKAEILGEIPQVDAVSLKTEILGEMPQQYIGLYSSTPNLALCSSVCASYLPRWQVDIQASYPPDNFPIMYVGKSNEQFQHGLLYEIVEKGQDTYTDSWNIAIIDIDSYFAPHPLPLSKFPMGFTGYIQGMVGFRQWSINLSYFEIFLSGGDEFQEGDVRYDDNENIHQDRPSDVSYVRPTSVAVFTNNEGDTLYIPDGYDTIKRWINKQYTTDGNLKGDLVERLDWSFCKGYFVPKDGSAPFIVPVQILDLCVCVDTYNFGINEGEAIWQPVVTSPSVS